MSLLIDSGVGFDDRRHDDTDVRGTGAQAVAHDACGDLAGNFTCLVTAHSVGDAEHHRFDDVRVLVADAHQPNIGRGTPPNGGLVSECDVVGHYSASNTVLPICTRSPLVIRSAAVSRLPLR